MNKYIAVLGRILLAFLFLAQMLMLINGFLNTPDGYQAYQAGLAMKGLPGIFAPLIILIQILGGLALLLGFKTKVAALIMAVYSVILTILLGLAPLQYLAIAGGLLLLAANPTMACSLDNLKK